MLPKQQRITSEKDFKRVYQKGSFFSAPLFNVNFLSNRLSFARLGIVINKKTEPKAVKRNKLKRQFREVARKIYHELPAGYDFVINIKAKAEKTDYNQIKAGLEAFKEKIKK